MLQTAAEAIAGTLRLTCGGDPITLARSFSFEVLRRDTESIIAALLPASPPNRPLVVLNERAPFALLSLLLTFAAAHQALEHRSLPVYCYTAAGPLGIPYHEADEARRFADAFLGTGRSRSAA